MAKQDDEDVSARLMCGFAAFLNHHLYLNIEPSTDLMPYFPPCSSVKTPASKTILDSPKGTLCEYG